MKLNRRKFLKQGSAALAAAGGTAALSADEKLSSPPAANNDAGTPRTASVFAYGYQVEPYPLPTGPHLFIDWRYIQCGRVAWQTADGKDAPLFAQEEIKGVRGQPGKIPYGIRLVAQPMIIMTTANRCIPAPRRCT